jgi:hypothetical protein
VSDGLGFDVISPVSEGGKFYLLLSELMKDYTYQPTDGANWEINVPLIIPNILAYTHLGELVLPSGAFDTSLLGSLASIVRAAEWVATGKRNIHAVTVMGDDLGVFLTNDQKLPDIIEISETDPVDEKFKHCLGWNYMDPYKPHPDGLKFTGDDPVGTKSGVVGQTKRITHKRKLSYEEIRTVVGLYKGELDDGRTFLDVVRCIPKSEENYPRKIRELIIRDGTTKGRSQTVS